MDISYPHDEKWHHVAMTYDAEKKEAMLYLDGKPGTVPTSFKSPFIFDPQRLRIGENEYHGMGFIGGVTDVIIWPKLLRVEAIANHAGGEISTDIGKPLLQLPLRFANAEEARALSGKAGFDAEHVTWKRANVEHPMTDNQDWVFPQFKRQPFQHGRAFGALGALEYRRGNYQRASELLIQSVNNGRYLPEVKIRTRFGGDERALFIAIAMKKIGRHDEYERYRKYVNERLNKFEIRTWENPGELDVMERIKLKTLQKDMNALAEE
jgi:hypothetical protein